jgi:hypothetical protein
MVHTKQEPCQLMARIMRVVEQLPRGPHVTIIFLGKVLTHTS